MALDFRPVLKVSIKTAGVPRGWSVSEHRGKVKLHDRSGAGGAAASWTKTLPIQWEVGCIGSVTETNHFACKAFLLDFLGFQFSEMLSIQ